MDFLRFIFESPLHYFGFIFLWFCTIGSIQLIHMETKINGSN